MRTLTSTYTLFIPNWSPRNPLLKGKCYALFITKFAEINPLRVSVHMNKLFWLTGGEKEYESFIQERLFLFEVLRDETVKVLLVKVNSETGER